MVGLVFCGDLKYCPYVKRYIERLEVNGIEYRVYFWNRGGFELNLPSNYTYYNSFSNLTKGKLSKAFDFFGFRKWLTNRLGTDKPDRLIILSTLSGVLLGRSLYKSTLPYLFDIRDYSYEHIWPFFEIEKKVIKNSYFTAISSKGFAFFLPQSEYVIAHNFNRKDIDNKAKFEREDGKLTFVWNGVIRYFEYQKQYLNALKNDSRFKIVFHGDGPDLPLYRDYCEKEGFSNVEFTGPYDNSQKGELLKDAAILNNCYGYTKNAGNKLRFAVSNRFYDGIIYHIPQLVEPEGYKTSWTKHLKVGTSIEMGNDFADKLYDYYRGINPIEFDICCENALKEVLKEDDEYIRRIDEFIRL